MWQAGTLELEPSIYHHQITFRLWKFQQLYLLLNAIVMRYFSCERNLVTWSLHKQKFDHVSTCSNLLYTRSVNYLLRLRSLHGLRRLGLRCLSMESILWASKVTLSTPKTFFCTLLTAFSIVIWSWYVLHPIHLSYHFPIEWSKIFCMNEPHEFIICMCRSLMLRRWKKSWGLVSQIGRHWGNFALAFSRVDYDDEVLQIFSNNIK